MQSKVERLVLKTLFPQRKSLNALGTTRSTLFADMLLREIFNCIVLAQEGFYPSGVISRV